MLGSSNQYSFNNGINSILNKDSFKINASQLCKCINVEKQREFSSYIAMLLEMRKYEFIDFIEGDFKYKEKDVSKSNVYSIELKNSNLNYNVINFDEMLAICKSNASKFGFKDYDEDTKMFYDITNDENGNEILIPISGFIDVINQLGFREILDITMNDDVEMLKKAGFEIPYKSYKFYNVNDSLNNDIHTKMELRKQLEKSIKKSITRYAPVNTTLWKIKYTGL